MKIEIDENTYWLCLWSAVIIALTTIAVVGILAGVNYNKTALEKGYVETQMQGTGTRWTKP